MKKDIIKIIGEKPGPTVAIFGGIHGNEKAGVMTIDYLIKDLSIDAGVVYLVYGNPKAINQNSRYIEKNLNRCFLNKSKSERSYEEKRSVELMELLDECDALLDLHSYNQPYGESTPFAFCENDGLEIVRRFNVPIILTGIDTYEKGGTDGYMFNKGKIGVCVELGAIENPEKFVPLGIEISYQFMSYFGMVSIKNETKKINQKILKVSGIYKRRNKNFKFSKRFKTFDFIKKQELICTDGNIKVYSENDEYILFPGDTSPIGVEASLTAKE